MADLPRRKLLLVLFLGVASAFVIAAFPLVTGQVTPGSLYGVRLAVSTNDPALWATVNSVAGWWMLGLAALTAVLAIALYRRPMTDQQYGFRVAFPLMAGLLLGLVLLRVTYLR